MSAEEQWALVAVGLVCLVSVVISWKGLRWSRSTGDVYVASRSVSPMMNASAVAGEYLSAASFLGVAGLILAYGSQGLWFPVCSASRRVSRCASATRCRGPPMRTRGCSGKTWARSRTSRSSASVRAQTRTR